MSRISGPINAEKMTVEDGGWVWVEGHGSLATEHGESTDGFIDGAVSGPAS